MGRIVLWGLITSIIGLGMVAEEEFAVCNASPTATDDSFSLEGPGWMDVTANDHDADGNPLTISNISPTSGSWGSLTSQPNGLVSFTPSHCLSTADFGFTYTLSDGAGGSDTAFASVHVSQGVDIFCDDFETGDTSKWSSSSTR